MLMPHTNPGPDGPELIKSIPEEMGYDFELQEHLTLLKGIHVNIKQMPVCLNIVNPTAVTKIL